MCPNELCCLLLLLQLEESFGGPQSGGAVIQQSVANHARTDKRDGTIISAGRHRMLVEEGNNCSAFVVSLYSYARNEHREKTYS